VPKPSPKEFRDDVVAVARRRGPKTALKQVAADFGFSKSRLTNSLANADREDGIRPRPATAELEEIRALRRRGGRSASWWQCSQRDHDSEISDWCPLAPIGCPTTARVGHP